ncbi:DUF6907 domain-containing protein [Streptomyces netropsis]|uniref:DUF6907 domain-containing protein n=1 Tax=Streptomyces netropsis TaxID=55404 RepID=UPI003799B465
MNHSVSELAEVPRCDALAGQCTGTDCGANGDPREPFHRGPAYSMNGSYGRELLEFSLTHWPEQDPELEFISDGTWPSLSLPQVDELISDLEVHLRHLRHAREQLAVLTGADQTRVTLAGVRADVAALLIDRSCACAVQGGDEQLPAARALDIQQAAYEGIEDAAAFQQS